MPISLERLQEFRYLGDEDADRTIQNILGSGEIVSVNEIFTHLVSNQDIPDDSHPEIHAFFERQSILPEDVDPVRFQMGHEVFMKYGPSILLSLFCKSLPECYACAKGAEVLAQTGRLELKKGKIKRYARRLMETAQFVVDVLWDKAFEEEGKGFLAIHKIRLVHAAIRFYLSRKGWDMDHFGLPINQEDMAGTLLSFSVSVLQGLDRLGVTVEESERDGYMYLWAHIGRLMGIHEELIPGSYEEGLALMEKIFDHQLAPSESGQLLARSCHEFMDYVIPGTFFDGYPEVLTHRLCDERVVAVLEMEAHEALQNKILYRLTRVISQVSDFMEDNSLMVHEATHKFGKRFLEGIFEYYNDWKEIKFNIPPSLRKDWEDLDVVPTP